MSKKIIISGFENSGKTFCFELLKQIFAESYSHSLGYFKPFDKGLISKNATESSVDAELLVEKYSLEENVNLLNPYLANEDFVFDYAAKRDGIKISDEVLRNNLKILEDRYPMLAIETPQNGFFERIGDGQFFDRLPEDDYLFLWVVVPEESSFTRVAEVSSLFQTLGHEVAIVLNNRENSPDGNYIKYLWDFLAERHVVLGMIPPAKEKFSITEFTGKYREFLPLLDSFLAEKLSLHE